MAEYILEIKHLSKSFGTNRVLKDISFNVKPGTVVGLMGENGAGKSTLMKCLFGMYGKDTGEFFLDGKEINFNGAKEALENGLAMVHQELNQCLNRNVLDNMFLGKYKTRFGIIDNHAMTKEYNKLIDSLGLHVSPHRTMGKLSVSQRQLLEIAKAISYKSKVIILDEPTSSLSEKESKKLFQIINDLKVKGVSFIFISHKMNEIFEICDKIVVMRDGEITLDKPIPETNLDEIVKAMIGRSLTSRFPPLDNTPGDVVLEVKDLNSKYTPILKNINFSLRKGEILGLYGLVGAGRSELLETLFGVRTASTGEIIYKGKRIWFKSAKEAMDYNFAFVTEERKANGMFGKGSLKFNTTIANLDKYKRAGILSELLMNKATIKQIEQMHVKCQGGDQTISALSGGNQQKIIIGKWLERSPDVFLMDEPTRGIDIMAKYQIYQLMIDLAKQGKSIIMVSSEMPEILGVTNRIIVMSNYQIAGELETKTATQEQILQLCAKYL